jgi:uncharacterized membrane protein
VNLLTTLTLITAIGSGLTAGAFLAFSTFIMKALGRLAAPVGIAAMQSINVVVINPIFMTVLFGPALLGIGLGVWAVINWQRGGAAMLLAGAATYVIGTAGVTIVFNVPRNDALAAVDPATSAGAHVWETYLREWTFFNHIRTLAAVVAVVLLTLAWRRLQVNQG